MFLKKGFGFSKSAAPLKICSWNINGIRSLLKKQFQFDADIVCLSELRIDAETYEKKKIASKYLQGYKKFHDFSKKKKGYSGVGIYTK
jgi:exonuclease III